MNLKAPRYAIIISEIELNSLIAKNGKIIREIPEIGAAPSWFPPLEVRKEQLKNIELTAENIMLRKVLDAVWEALDGLYGGDGNGEEIPINLLPEDRQQLFHRVLELFGDIEGLRG